jgi:hypothetical protein
VLLETAILDLVLSAGLRTKVIHARCAWEQNHAGDALDGFCSELAQKPFLDTVGGVHNVNRSLRRIRSIHTHYDTLDDCLLSHLIYIEYDYYPKCAFCGGGKCFCGAYLPCCISSTRMPFCKTHVISAYYCNQTLWTRCRPIHFPGYLAYRCSCM